MPGAPVLGSKQIGTLIALLKAVLIEGFNTLNPVASGVTYDSGLNEVTVTFATAHGYLLHQIIEMSGCTQTEYNGEFRVVYVDTLTLKYIPDVAPSVTPATGTPETKTAPVGGWAVVHEDLVTNIEAAFQRTDPDATPYTMIIKNNGNEGAYTLGNEWMARVIMAANYVDLVTYDTVLVGSKYWPASWNNSSGEEWFFVGDPLLFYWTTRFAAGSGRSTIVWGDINSVLEGDSMHCIQNSLYSSSAAEWDVAGEAIHQQFPSMVSTYFRDIAGDNAQTPLTPALWQMQGVGTFIGTSGVSFPNDTTNEFMVSPMEVMCIVNTAVRGYMPGIVQPLHSTPAYHGVILDNFVAFNNDPIMFWYSNGVTAGNGAQYLVGFNLENWRA